MVPAENVWLPEIAMLNRSVFHNLLCTRIHNSLRYVVPSTPSFFLLQYWWRQRPDPRQRFSCPNSEQWSSIVGTWYSLAYSLQRRSDVFPPRQPDMWGAVCQLDIQRGTSQLYSADITGFHRFLLQKRGMGFGICWSILQLSSNGISTRLADPTSCSSRDTEENPDLFLDERRHPECDDHILVHSSLLAAVRVRGENFLGDHRAVILLYCSSDDIWCNTAERKQLAHLMWVHSYITDKGWHGKACPNLVNLFK